MTLSMTAFARSERPTSWGKLGWEIRSVNHRYLEVALRLPEDLRGLETKVREKIGERITRGRVDAALYWKPEARADVLEVDNELLARVGQTLKSLQAFGIATAPANALDLLRWPGVMRSTSPDVEKLTGEAMSLLDQALDELRDTREREGGRLKKFMTDRLSALDEHVKTVRTVVPEVTQEYRERLRTRLSDISATLDPQRLEQEIVIFANRTDVAEELDRLSAHSQEARRVLDGGGQIGRRLDFLMQEFNREANTLASKSADLRVTGAAVELKVLIEQMREQVQNIE